MSQGVKTIAVSKCGNCPFFAPSPLAGVGKLLSVQIMSGHCRYVAFEGGGEFIADIRMGLPPGPEREREIKKAKSRIEIGNKDVAPESCPLRSGDLVVSLGS